MNAKRKSTRLGVRRLVFAGGVSALAGLVAIACSGKVTQQPGLEVIIESAGLTSGVDFDTVDVEVAQETSPGQWHTILNAPRSAAEAPLPTTVAIASGANSDQDALITVTALERGVALVQRIVEVQIPTNRVAELVMVLAQDCVGKVTTCSNGSCQPTTGKCGSNVIDPSTLANYTPSDADGVDAGSGRAPSGAEGDATTAVTDATLADSTTTFSTPDGSTVGVEDAQIDVVDSAAPCEGRQPCTLYERLGEHAGVRTLVDDILAAELADPDMVSYFFNQLSSPVPAGHPNADQLEECFTDLLGSAFGGPETYPTTVVDDAGSFPCRDMTTIHRPLKISGGSFDRFVMIASGVLVSAPHSLATADVETIGAILTATRSACVDPNLADAGGELYPGTSAP